MRIRLCLMAGIFGIAVVAGVLDSLSTPVNNKEQEGEKALEAKEKTVE